MVDSNEVAEHPCRKVSILRGEQGRTQYLLPQEEERLMGVLDGQRSPLKDMVVMVINTELRISEVFNLKPEHVNFHHDVLYIKDAKTDEDRDVPLNNVSRELLAALVGKAHRQGGEYLLTNPQTKTKCTSVKTA